MSPVDPSSIPTGEQVDASRPTIEVLAYILSTLGIGGIFGWRASKRLRRYEEKVFNAQASADTAKSVAEAAHVAATTVQANLDKLEDEIKAEFISKADHASVQSNCVSGLVNRILLILEERDRDRDNKIHEKMAAVCKEVAALSKEVAVLSNEIRRVNERRHLDN